MVQLDDRILERLDEDGWLSPSVLAADNEFDASEDRIRERCLNLADAELIAPIARRMYDITQWGQLYLEGELDAEHQPIPTIHKVLTE
jgi:hypothetical protein